MGAAVQGSALILRPDAARQCCLQSLLAGSCPGNRFGELLACQDLAAARTSMLGGGIVGSSHTHHCSHTPPLPPNTHPQVQIHLYPLPQERQHQHCEPAGRVCVPQVAKLEHHHMHGAAGGVRGASRERGSRHSSSVCMRCANHACCRTGLPPAWRCGAHPPTHIHTHTLSHARTHAPCPAHIHLHSPRSITGSEPTTQRMRLSGATTLCLCL